VRNAALALALVLVRMALGYQFGRKTIVVHLCPETASVQKEAGP
jgi:hypothetical protein